MSYHDPETIVLIHVKVPEEPLYYVYQEIMTDPVKVLVRFAVKTRLDILFSAARFVGI